MSAMPISAKSRRSMALAAPTASAICAIFTDSESRADASCNTDATAAAAKSPRPKALRSGAASHSNSARSSPAPRAVRSASIAQSYAVAASPPDLKLPHANRSTPTFVRTSLIERACSNARSPTDRPELTRPDIPNATATCVSQSVRLYSVSSSSATLTSQDDNGDNPRLAGIPADGDIITLAKTNPAQCRSRFREHLMRV